MPTRLSAAALAKQYPNGVFVYAGADDKILAASDPVPAMMKIAASYKCPDCGTSIVASVSDGVEPYCTHCGSEHLEKSSQPKNLTASAILPAGDDLQGVQCHSCRSVNVITASYLKSSDNHLHCGICGTHLQAAAADPDADLIESFDKKGTDLVDPAAEDESAAHEEAETPAQEAAEEVEEKEVEASDLSTDDTLTVDTEHDPVAAGVVPKMTAPVVATEVAPVEPVAEVDAGGHAEETTPVVATDDADADDTQMVLAEVPVQEPVVPGNTSPVLAGDQGNAEAADLLESGLDDISDVSMHMTAGRLVISKGFVNVYTLSASDAKENAQLLGTPVLAQAVQREISRFGLKAAAKTFGFKPVKVTSYSRREIEAAVQKATSDSAERITASKKGLEDCLALAAVGIAKGVYKEHKNPLAASVESALTMAGIENAKEYTASMFSEAGVVYAKNLISLAAKLQAMPESVRQHHKTDIIDMVSSESANATLEARLGSTAVKASVVSTQQPVKLQASSSTHDRVSDILSGKGSLGFF